MDDILLRSRLSRPVVTGVPQAHQVGGRAEAAVRGDAFSKVLSEQILGTAGQQPVFSKHAVSRMEERGIPITQTTISRLQKGMELAQQKGLDDALIITDQAAFIVSARNRAVITAMNNSDLKNSVITNINGTVIL